jgi:hypothetical protein
MSMRSIMQYNVMPAKEQSSLHFVANFAGHAEIQQGHAELLFIVQFHSVICAKQP